MYEKPKTVPVTEDEGIPQQLLDMTKKNFLPYGGVTRTAVLRNGVGGRIQEDL